MIRFKTTYVSKTVNMKSMTKKRKMEDKIATKSGLLSSSESSSEVAEERYEMGNEDTQDYKSKIHCN